MIRHVVVFEWNDRAGPAEVAVVAEGLAGLPVAIPEIRRYEFGADLGLAEGNAHYGVVADFHDVDGYIAYRDHPTHRALIADRIAPLIASRTAVQYEVLD